MAEQTRRTLLDILTVDALKTLRGGFQEPRMIEATGTALTTLFPKSAVIVDSILQEYQGGDDLAPRDRERCIITMLATQDAGLTLAVHMYWGLMEGLDPLEIANTLLLMGAYSGIPHFAHGALILRDLLTELAALAEQGGEAVKSPSVLKALMNRF
ncbi:MAG: hypothetical protein EXR72_18405 [Myxococcales bacterium]|nr:hypothetical protein [Myxococcales bacterium]